MSKMSYTPLNFVYPPKTVFKPSFGTCDRYMSYQDEADYTYRTSTSMFRNDIDWQEFSEFLGSNFSDKQNVNVICHACSDGSEPYSLAISLIETLGENKAQKFFPIYAKDKYEVIIDCANTGLINLGAKDLKYFKEHNIDMDKYFVKSDKKLRIPKDFDAEYTDTYEVKPILKSKVKFHCSDIFDDIYDIDDNSNTIFLLRNVLPYMGYSDAETIIDTLKDKLKEGSVISPGEFTDRHLTAQDYNNLLKSAGFEYYDQTYGAIKSRTCIKTNNSNEKSNERFPLYYRF